MGKTIVTALAASVLAFVAALGLSRAHAGSAPQGVPCATASGVPTPHLVDPLGNQRFTIASYATYNASVGMVAANAITAAANPTDILVLTGSATKDVQVVSVSIYMGQTAAYTATFANGPSVVFTKRTTADTGGTPVALTGTAVDSADPAATASLSYYTANPTRGTAALVTAANYTAIPVLTGAPNLLSLSGMIVGSFSVPQTTKPMVLHGVNESLCADLQGVAHAGLQFGLLITWVETARQ